MVQLFLKKKNPENELKEFQNRLWPLANLYYQTTKYQN